MKILDNNGNLAAEFDDQNVWHTGKPEEGWHLCTVAEHWREFVTILYFHNGWKRSRYRGDYEGKVFAWLPLPEPYRSK